MVNIAIAGGSSNVGAEILDALLETKKHNILLLSRKDVPTNETRPNVQWAQTDYTDLDSLAKILTGSEVVLSFIDPQRDENNISQRTLIDACVKAGVKRFAPSEWSWSNIDHLPFYDNKRQIRTYLSHLNQNEKKLEYTLFTPGLFLNYLTYPYPSSPHLHLFELWLDFHNTRALTISLDDRITLTDIRDLAAVVAKAVEFEGEWPVMGGVKGEDVSVGELLEIGRRVRGKEFEVELLEKEDLERGEVKSRWLPTVGHHSVEADKWKGFVPVLVSSFALSVHAGAGVVGDEWNQRVHGVEFEKVEEFLERAWRDKPVS